MKQIKWYIILIAFVIQQLFQAMFESAVYMVSGRFMLVLGTPVWRLYECYSHSPLGYFLNSAAFVASSFAGGYAMSYMLRRWRHATTHLVRIYHVLTFVLLYILIYVVALGFNVPGYAHYLSFGETVTWLCGAIAVFVGSYVVERDET